jgi:hypothetical protein
MIIHSRMLGLRLQQNKKGRRPEGKKCHKTKTMRGMKSL